MIFSDELQNLPFEYLKELFKKLNSNIYENAGFIF